MDNKLSFKGNDPGAVQYGNFINYYQFHPPCTRINTLPRNLWNSDNLNTENCVALDIGCNSGNLTVELQKFLSANSDCTQVSILGVDIDPILISRANETQNEGLAYSCLDIMNTNSENTLKDYLKQFGKEKFDVIFCFSVTMWIHLNFGDDGLKRFLNLIKSFGNILVIEPQPWKCYKTAVKRMKKSSQFFPLFRTLKITKDIESEIQSCITDDCSFTNIFVTFSSEWNRKLYFFQKNMKK